MAVTCRLDSDNIVLRKDTGSCLYIVSRCGGELKEIIDTTHYLRRWSHESCVASEDVHSHLLLI